MEINIDDIKEEISAMSFREKIDYIDDIALELEQLKTDITEQHETEFKEVSISSVKKYIVDNKLQKKVAVYDEGNTWYVEFDFKNETYQLLVVQAEYEEPHINISMKDTIYDNDERNAAFKALADTASLSYKEDNHDISILTSEKDCTDDICYILSKI